MAFALHELCVLLATDLKSIVYLTPTQKTMLSFMYNYLARTDPLVLSKSLGALDWEHASQVDIVTGMVGSDLDSEIPKRLIQEVYDSLKDHDRDIIDVYFERVKVLVNKLVVCTERLDD